MAKRHGLSLSREHKSWESMIHRCTNKNAANYAMYGGRGITVCEEWLQFENFYRDMGERPNGHSLDRINNNLGYFKDNCRWASTVEQLNNRRNNHLITFCNKTQTLSQWAREIGLKPKTLSARINDEGWSIEKALTTKLRVWK